MPTRLTLLLVLFCLAACASNPTQVSDPRFDGASPSVISPSPTYETASSGVPTVSPPIETMAIAPRDIIEMVKRDLLSRLNIPIEKIKILEAIETVWPDTSLGCPQSNQEYSQVLTPGFWILAEADSQQYPYHTDKGEEIILCIRDATSTGTETPPLPLIPVNPTKIKDGIPWVPVN